MEKSEKKNWEGLRQKSEGLFLNWGKMTGYKAKRNDTGEPRAKRKKLTYS